VFFAQDQFIYCVFFCVFGVFSLVCFELSVPVQVLPGRTRLRNVLCFERDVKLVTHSPLSFPHRVPYVPPKEVLESAVSSLGGV